VKHRYQLGVAGQASCPARCAILNHKGTYNHLSASSLPSSSSCSVCAASTAPPEVSRGSDCGTGRGLAYNKDRSNHVVLTRYTWGAARTSRIVNRSASVHVASIRAMQHAEQQAGGAAASEPHAGRSILRVHRGSRPRAEFIPVEGE
jgi:hypothetical protein